jgi:hypothetical protein
VERGDEWRLRRWCFEDALVYEGALIPSLLDFELVMSAEVQRNMVMLLFELQFAVQSSRRKDAGVVHGRDNRTEFDKAPGSAIHKRHKVA